MYQPGFDQGLARIRYAEVLEAAANERADRRTRGNSSKPAARRLVLALTAVAPLALMVAWVVAAH